MYSRLRSKNDADSSHTEHAPDEYEMSSDMNNQYATSNLYTEVEFDSPVMSNGVMSNSGITQPSAAAGSSSRHDLTAFDNYVYK